MKFDFNYLLILLIFFLLPASSIHPILGIKIHYIFIFTILVASAIQLKGGMIGERKVFSIAIFLVLLGTIATLVSGVFSQILMGITLAFMLILSPNIFLTAIKSKYFSFILILTYLILAGAWIGFFYAFFGGTPLSVHQNKGGVDLYFYLSTFAPSMAIVGNLIRPSGVFDEPGALSMFVTIVLVINLLRDGAQIHSFLLLLLMQISFSFTGFIIFILFLLFSIKNKITIYIVSIVIILSLSATTFFRGEESPVERWFTGRLIDTFKDPMSNNRTSQVTLFFEIVNEDIIRTGSNAPGHEGKGGGGQSSNPFSIIYAYGLLIWIPYAFVILMLLKSILICKKQLKLSALIMFLLLLQRPYIYDMYWGIMIMITNYAILNYSKNEYSKKIQIPNIRSGLTNNLEILSISNYHAKN